MTRNYVSYTNFAQFVNWANFQLHNLGNRQAVCLVHELGIDTAQFTKWAVSQIGRNIRTVAVCSGITNYIYHDRQQQQTYRTVKVCNEIKSDSLLKIRNVNTLQSRPRFLAHSVSIINLAESTIEQLNCLCLLVRWFVLVCSISSEQLCNRADERRPSDNCSRLQDDVRGLCPVQWRSGCLWQRHRHLLAVLSEISLRLCPRLLRVKHSPLHTGTLHIPQKYATIV